MMSLAFFVGLHHYLRVLARSVDRFVQRAVLGEAHDRIWRESERLDLADIERRGTGLPDYRAARETVDFQLELMIRNGVRHA